MKPDPIVEEVRAIREKLAAECGFNVRRMFEQSRKRQAESNAVIVDYSRRSKKATETEPIEQTEDRSAAVRA